MANSKQIKLGLLHKWTRQIKFIKLFFDTAENEPCKVCPLSLQKILKFAFKASLYLPRFPSFGLLTPESGGLQVGGWPLQCLARLHILAILIRATSPSGSIEPHQFHSHCAPKPWSSSDPAVVALPPGCSTPPGLPLRKGVEDCTFYMKTGNCKSEEHSLLWTLSTGRKFCVTTGSLRSSQEISLSQYNTLNFLTSIVHLCGTFGRKYYNHSHNLSRLRFFTLAQEMISKRT